MLSSKSQVIMEFMLLSGMALIVSIIFIASISQNKALHEAKEFFLAKDVALKIQNEISITSRIEDGYTRQFDLPEKISSKDYNMSIMNNTLTVLTNSTLYITNILNITGYLKKGPNTITKSNGAVHIN